MIGGFSYVIIELIWRAYSHISMFFVGGICFVIIGGINEFYTYEMNSLMNYLLDLYNLFMLQKKDLNGRESCQKKSYKLLKIGVHLLIDIKNGCTLFF